MDVLLIQILAFLAVIFLVTGINSVARGRTDAAPENGANWVFTTFSREIEAIGALIEPTLSRAFPSKTRVIQKDLVAASLADTVPVMNMRGLQGLLAASALVAALTVVFLVSANAPLAGWSAVILGCLGWIYPTLWLSRTAAGRRDAIRKSLPYAIDLITVAMEAGQDFGAALRYLVTEGFSGPLAHEFSIMLHQVDLGKSRAVALRDMVGRVQLEEFSGLVTAVVQGMEMGASIVSVLRIQAEDIRRKRFHRAERKAARAPSIMIIPVALFILPAVFIIIFTPVGIRVFESFGSMR